MSSLEGKKTYDIKEARAAMERYCVVRERSQREVQQRMKELGLIPIVQDDILVHLIQNDFLNERRYATAFAVGHFRQTGWGKIKIRYALRQNGVADAAITEALQEIKDEEYTENLFRQAEKKWASLREKTRKEKERKLYAYLQSKGFESDRIAEAIKTIP